MTGSDGSRHHDISRCVVCGAHRSGPGDRVFVRNSYGDWLCLGCNEWLFHYLLDPDLGLPPADAMDCAAIKLGQPWERADYVPEGAEPMYGFNCAGKVVQTGVWPPLPDWLLRTRRT